MDNIYYDLHVIVFSLELGDIEMIFINYYDY